MKVVDFPHAKQADIDPNELTVKDLQQRWKPISVKTVRRQIQRLRLVAYRTVGVRPRFRLSDVVAAEMRAKEMVNAALMGDDPLPSDHVLTTREARALAGKKKRRVR